MHTSRRLAARLAATAFATCVAAVGLALVPAGESGGQRLGVVDAGIGGNRVVTDSPSAQQGIAAVTRFSHDVLTQPGVKNAIVLEGINDINITSVTADQIRIQGVLRTQVQAAF